MKNTTPVLLAILLTTSLSLDAAMIYLDGDSPATGSALGTTPLVTPLGTVTFSGEFSSGSDPDLTAAGSTGNVFDIDNGSQQATLFFDFDVASFTFLYGGNIGHIDIRGRDINNVVVASFFQADTNAGQPAGPITLTGTAMRSLFWTDTTGSFAPLDNIQVSNVPEPTSGLLCLIGSVLFLGRSRSRCQMR